MRRRGMKTGVRAHDFGIVRCDELLKRFIDNNVEVTQLPLPRVFNDFPLDNKLEALKYAQRVGEKFSQAGISIDVLSCYINIGCINKQLHDSEIKRFDDFLDYAVVAGAKMVGTETGSVNADYSFDVENHSEESYRRVIKSLEPLVRKAEDLGTFIGIEAVHRHVIHSPKVTMRLLKDLSSKNVQIILDPVNLINIENYQRQIDIFEEAFFLYADKIKVFHFKSFEIDNELLEIPFGSGLFQWEEFLELAKTYHVEANVVFEGTSIEHYNTARVKINEFSKL